MHAYVSLCYVSMSALGGQKAAQILWNKGHI